MKILYVYPIYTRKNKLLSPYLLNDLEIVREKYSVRKCEFISLQKKHFFQILRDVVLLFFGVFWSDLTLCWFGRLHAFFAVLFSKILRKKVIIIAGGDEATNIIIDGKLFGLWANPIKRLFVKFIFKYTDKIIAVSKFNLMEISENSKISSEKVELIYHGFDSRVFFKREGINKEQIIVCIGNIDKENFERKGLKLFVECAIFIPEGKFFMIGSKFGTQMDDTFQRLKKIAANNVAFTGRVSHEELLNLLSGALVYVQASKHEAFGCSVAEAMLCECIPVVSNRTALPEVVGDCGFYLGELTPEELANKIKEAFKHPEYGKLARQRIKENFPLQKRRDKLLNLIESINS